jgi:site-specific DNA recombinase
MVPKSGRGVWKSEGGAGTIRIMNSAQGMTCILYCRVSFADQVEGTSLDSQERLCREYAVRQGWDVLKTYIERGESAKTADRTELNRAIEFCRAEKVDTFLVYKLDRFARNQFDHVTVRALLRRHGTEVRSVTEPIDDTPVGRMMEGVLAAVAQYDNDVRADRTRQGMYARIQQGVWITTAPLGYYRPQPGANIAPDANLAPLIRLIFQEYAKGTYTYERLARFIAERGLSTALGKGPCRQLIQRILRNPIYCGLMRIRGDLYPGAFEPIVSAELYEACREIWDRPSLNLAIHQTNNPDFPLRRLVICAECRRPLTGSSSVGRNGRRYPYYHHLSSDCQLARSVPKGDLEREFFKLLRSISPRPRFLTVFRASVRQVLLEKQKQQEINRVVLNREIATLEKDRQSVFEQHRRGIYKDDDFREQLQRVNKCLKQKHLLLSEQVPGIEVVERLVDGFGELIQNTAELWHRLEADHNERLRLQRQVFRGPLTFDGRSFGNPDLSIVYEWNRDFHPCVSRMVPLISDNWKKVLEELTNWSTFLHYITENERASERE